jgi:hypothetical protein
MEPMTMAPEYSALHEAVDLLSPRQARDLFRSIEKMLGLNTREANTNPGVENSRRSASSLYQSLPYKGSPLSLADMDSAIADGAVESMS